MASAVSVGSSACVTRPQHDHPSSMGYRPAPALPAHRPGTPARVLAPSLRAPLQQRGRGQRLHPTQRPPTSPPHGKASWWEGTPLPPPPPLEVSRVVRGGPLELGLADPDLGSQAAPPSPGSNGTKPPFEERGGAGPLSQPPVPAPAPGSRAFRPVRPVSGLCWGAQAQCDVGGRPRVAPGAGGRFLLVRHA